jgi:hypothetical protein
MPSDLTLDLELLLFETSVAEAFCDLNLEDRDLLLFLEQEGELERKLVKNDESANSQ